MRTAFLALATAAAQPSNSTYYGMYKATWATSDPIHTTYPFLTELLGNLPTDNNCPNLTCACGTQGRTELNGTHGFGSEDHFGVHTVEAAGVNGSRLRASGAYSLEEIEAIWGAALGEMDAYDTFLDNHLALWAPDLAPYVERFQAAAVPALGLRWAFRGERYASLLVHVPKSQVVLELISQTAPPGVRWVAVDEVRHRFEDGPPAVPAGRLEPLHVSRFAADLDVIEVFYDRVLGEKPSAVDFPLDKADPTSKRLVYGGPGSFTPDVALVFVTRAEPSNRVRSASWFQRYAVAVGEHYMRNYTDCWPVWGDDRRPATSFDRERDGPFRRRQPRRGPDEPRDPGRADARRRRREPRRHGLAPAPPVQGRVQGARRLRAERHLPHGPERLDDAARVARGLQEHDAPGRGRRQRRPLGLLLRVLRARKLTRAVRVKGALRRRRSAASARRRAYE